MRTIIWRIDPDPPNPAEHYDAMEGTLCLCFGHQDIQQLGEMPLLEDHWGDLSTDLSLEQKHEIIRTIREKSGLNVKPVYLMDHGTHELSFTPFSGEIGRWDSYLAGIWIAPSEAHDAEFGIWCDWAAGRNLLWRYADDDGVWQCAQSYEDLLAEFEKEHEIRPAKEVTVWK